jgi:hypothetical protein
MSNRVDRGRERVNKIASEVMPQGFDNINNNMIRLIKEHPEKKEVLENQLAKLPQLRPKLEKEFPRTMWHYNLNPQVLPQFLGDLRSMTWIFLTSKNKHAFITSDNPVYFEGSGRPEPRVIFPICSTTVLLASWHDKIREDYYNVKDSFVREINKRIASEVTRYVFYSQNDPGIISLVNKKNLKY